MHYSHNQIHYFKNILNNRLRLLDNYFYLIKKALLFLFIYQFF